MATNTDRVTHKLLTAADIFDSDVDIDVEPSAPMPKMRVDSSGGVPVSTSLSTFVDRASSMVEHGVPVVPLPPRKKSPPPKGWQDFATTNIETIKGWLVANGQPAIATEDSNCACVATLDGVWFLDIDNMKVVSEQIENDTGHRLQEIMTLIVRSSAEKRHLYFKQNDASRALGNVDHDGPNGAELCSARVNGKYVVSALSIHPDTGAEYKITRNMAIIEAPKWLTDWLKTAKRSNGERKEKLAADNTTKISEGGRDEFLFAEACKLRDTKMSPEAALAALLVINKDQCVPPMAKSVVEIKIKSAYSRDARVKQNAKDHIESGTSPTSTPFSSAPVLDDLAPILSDDALYGLAGDIVKKIMPETESHPAGLLVQTLMYFGNIIGRTAYFQVESTRHYGNLFAVRIGVSSKSRKGTGGDRIDAVYENVDPYWFTHRKLSGLSSGEGLIVAIQDEVLEKNKRGELVIADGGAGVSDKRVLSYEGEFAQVLSVMQRQGATIVTNLRNAWDGKTLRTMTIRPRSASNHTVSVLGDVTKFDLVMMNQQDAQNGFANRFLWVHVDRTQLLPFGGEELDFTPEVERLQSAIEFAKQQGRVFMDRNAREMWQRAYGRLSVAEDGLFGAAISRGEAQVIRLALLYALMDDSTRIRSEHLQAGLAFWQYCEDSARYIFGGLTEEQKMILEFLREHGSQMKTTILKSLFQRNRPAELIAADLGALKKRGLIGKVPNTNGTEIYFAQGRK